MSLEKNMLDVILKDLPNQTSGVLKTYLDQTEQDKESLKRLNVLLEDKNKSSQKLLDQIGSLQKEIDNLKIKIKKQEDLDDQEMYVKEQLRMMDNSSLRIELNMEKQSNEKIMELCRLVFRNPSFTKTVHQTVPVVVRGGSGSGYTNADTVNTIATSTTAT